jgi:hypothetical protein
MTKLKHCGSGLAVILLIASGADARAASEGGWAWAHSPTGTYNPFPGHSWNSSGGAITITHLGPGSYSVFFAGIGTEIGGHVQISAHNGKGYCNSNGWSSGASGVTAMVKCFSASGVPENNMFTIAYQRRTGLSSGFSAYVWNNLISSSGTPSITYQWNSTEGGPISSRNFDVGKYLVSFPGLGVAGSGYEVAAVTAYGFNSYCRTTGGVIGGGLPADINVDCQDGAGNPTNSRFNLFFGHVPIHAPSWMWRHVGADGSPFTFSGWVSVGDGGFGSQNNVRSGRNSVGRYWVRSSDISTVPSSIALVANSGSNARCRIFAWGTTADGDTEVDVDCHDHSGNLADSDFSVIFASTHGVLH